MTFECVVSIEKGWLVHKIGWKFKNSLNWLKINFENHRQKNQFPMPIWAQIVSLQWSFSFNKKTISLSRVWDFNITFAPLNWIGIFWSHFTTIKLSDSIRHTNTLSTHSRSLDRWAKGITIDRDSDNQLTFALTLTYAFSQNVFGTSPVH